MLLYLTPLVLARKPTMLPVCLVENAFAALLISL